MRTHRNENLNNSLDINHCLLTLVVIFLYPLKTLIVSRTVPTAIMVMIVTAFVPIESGII